MNGDDIVFIFLGIVLGILLSVAVYSFKLNLVKDKCEQDLIEQNAPRNVQCVRGALYIQKEYYNE